MEYIKLFEEFDFFKFLKKKPKEEEQIQQEEWWLKGKSFEDAKIENFKVGDRVLVYQPNISKDKLSGTIIYISRHLNVVEFDYKLPAGIYPITIIHQYEKISNGKKGYCLPVYDQYLEKI